MTRNRQPIIWEGEVVGFVENLTADMFDLYGKWLPNTTTATQKFLSALRDGEQLWARVGEGQTSTLGTVEFEPEEQIDIKIRPEKTVR